MDYKTFEGILGTTIENMKTLSTLKGGEYAGDDDRLANFKRNAERLGIKPFTVWAVYAGKHWDAIQQFVNDQQNGKERKKLESMEGRFDDLIVYAVLGKALLLEGNQTTGTALKPIGTMVEVDVKKMPAFIIDPRTVK